jgi:hypothetical protein
LLGISFVQQYDPPSCPRRSRTLSHYLGHFYRKFDGSAPLSKLCSSTLIKRRQTDCTCVILLTRSLSRPIQ